LVALENYSSWPGELRTCLTYASSTYASSFSLFCLYLRQIANTTLSLQLPMKFSNIVWVETSRYLTKITILRRLIAKVLTAKHTASLQLLYTVGGNQARLDARTEFEILEPSLRGGVEASRAHHCILLKL